MLDLWCCFVSMTKVPTGKPHLDEEFRQWCGTLTITKTSSFNIHVPCWVDLDGLTKSKGSKDCFMLQCFFRHGFYGWRPSLPPTTLQSVLGAFYVPPAQMRLLYSLQDYKTQGKGLKLYARRMKSIKKYERKGTQMWQFVQLPFFTSCSQLHPSNPFY